MKEMISLDVLLSDEVCRLLDSFATVMKIQVVFFSEQGRILKRGRDFGNSEYCRLMQERYFSLEQCIQLDRKMLQSCMSTREICSYRCHAGLNELLAPIYILGRPAGYIMLGQFRATHEIPNCISHDAEAQRKFMNLPYFAADELGSLENMIRWLTDYIISKELISYTGNFRYQKILYYIEQHLTEKITLKQVAKYLDISESSLTHFLRSEYNTSFKRLFTEKRLAAAEQLWREYPALTVRETAFCIGYEDHYYFSRLYRQERGITPGEFKRTLAGTRRERGWDDTAPETRFRRRQVSVRGDASTPE